MNGPELRAAFAPLASLVGSLPTDGSGIGLTPADFVREVFGHDARVTPWSRANNAMTTWRWFETDVMVHVDSAWHTPDEVLAIAAALAKHGVRAINLRLDASGMPPLRYRIVLLLDLLRPADPPPPKTRALESGGWVSSPPSEEKCFECGARHWVWCSRKPFPGAEVDDAEVLCLACGRGTLRVSSSETGGWRVELLDEPDGEK